MHVPLNIFHRQSLTLCLFVWIHAPYELSFNNITSFARYIIPNYESKVRVCNLSVVPSSVHNIPVIHNEYSTNCKIDTLRAINLSKCSVKQDEDCIHMLHMFRRYGFKVYNSVSNIHLFYCHWEDLMKGIKELKNNKSADLDDMLCGQIENFGPVALR